MTGPWAEAIDLLSRQVAELARDDPDAEVLERLQEDLEALRPALAGDPPAGEAEAWAAAAREAARLTAAVADAAVQRRDEVARRQRDEEQRHRRVGAYAPAPVAEDPRFFDRRG